MASTKLWITEDVEFSKAITQRNADTGATEAAAGIAGLLNVRLSLTPGGVAIGSCSWTPAERASVPGTYFVVGDTATMVASLVAVVEGDPVYEVWQKTGDVEARSWLRTVRRQRVGNG